MSIKQGAISGLLFLSLSISALRARPDPGDLIPPPPENLDIPPEEPIDAEQLQALDQGRHAAEFPKEFHDLVLQLRPGWAALEAANVAAIADPEDYLKKHPKSPAELVAEEKAKEAILHPKKNG